MSAPNLWKFGKVSNFSKMVNVQRGILVTCDPAMKQFLLHLDESRALGTMFVLRDIDETHLMIDEDIVDTLKDKIDSLMESLAPDLADK